MDWNSRVNTLDGIIAGVNCPTKIYLPKKPLPIGNSMLRGHLLAMHKIFLIEMRLLHFGRLETQP